MIFCRVGLGGASNNDSWMRLRETKGNAFSLSDDAGLRSKKAAKAERRPSNLRVGPFDNAQHRQDRFIATNLANALETAHGRPSDSARYQRMSLNLSWASHFLSGALVVAVVAPGVLHRSAFSRRIYVFGAPRGGENI
jgi:hypothetical protein